MILDSLSFDGGGGWNRNELMASPILIYCWPINLIGIYWIAGILLLALPWEFLSLVYTVRSGVACRTEIPDKYRSKK